MAAIKKLLYIDLETYSETDLKTCGVYKYADDPAFEIQLIGYAYEDEEVRVVDIAQGESIPTTLLADLTNDDVLKIAHNANFERTCLQAALFDTMPPEQWECTAVRASTLGLPRSLAAVGEVLGLKEDEKKMSEGKRLVQYFSKPCQPTKVNGNRTKNLPRHEPERWELYKNYNRQDVVTERVIRQKLLKYPSTTAVEKELWNLDQRMNEGGVLVNTALVHNILAYSDRHTYELQEKAKAMSGVDNPSSFPQIRRYLKAKGIDTDSLDKEAVKELIKRLKGKEPEVVEFLKIRQELGKTSVTKYDAMERAICSDNRIRGMLQFYGANRTGRWCLAEGTMILVKDINATIYEKPIETVSTTDMVWDGENWVLHEGVVCNGEKETIEWDGVRATPEHRVYISKEKSITLKQAKKRRLKLWKGNSSYTK